MMLEHGVVLPDKCWASAGADGLVDTHAFMVHCALPVGRTSVRFKTDCKNDAIAIN